MRYSLRAGIGEDMTQDRGDPDRKPAGGLPGGECAGRLADDPRDQAGKDNRGRSFRGIEDEAELWKWKFGVMTATEEQKHTTPASVSNNTDIFEGPSF